MNVTGVYDTQHFDVANLPNSYLISTNFRRVFRGKQQLNLSGHGQNAIATMDVIDSDHL